MTVIPSTYHTILLRLGLKLWLYNQATVVFLQSTNSKASVVLTIMVKLLLKRTEKIILIMQSTCYWCKHAALHSEFHDKMAGNSQRVLSISYIPIAYRSLKIYPRNNTITNWSDFVDLFSVNCLGACFWIPVVWDV